MAVNKAYTSMLPTASDLEGALFNVSEVNAESDTGYESKKASISEVGAEIVSEIEWQTELTETTSKTITGAINEIKGNIDEIEGNVDELKNVLTYEKTVTNSVSIYTTNYTIGVMTTDGTVLTGGSYDNYKYSPKISVQQGDVFRGTTFRFVTAFSNGVAVSEKGGNSVSTYTVPEGVDEVVVSVSVSVSSFTYDYTRAILIPRNTPFSLDKNILSKAGAFTSGGSYNYILMTQAKSSLSKNFLAVFECDCVSGTDFEFGFTVSNSSPVSVHNNVISISSQNISYDGVDYAHGITIEGRIKLIVEQLSTAQAKVTLMANGVAFVQTIDYVITTTCSPYVRGIDLIANNCKLTYTCIDLQKSIWIFGDSYLSYSDNRWRYYLHSYGYDNNVLINAHSGAGSVNAIMALTNLIAIGKPKYIVWAIGMNDGSDTNSSTPSQAWVTGRDSLLAFCLENDITPIFCTIPNVATVSNIGKNAWIKSSGYKYIDLCHAVGADETTSWLGTMLSNDGVHPSVTGAKALFAQVISDFTEITIST